VVRRQLAGLEAEVRLLRRQVAIDADRVAGLEADNARLTAEVGRLRGRLERRGGKASDRRGAVLPLHQAAQPEAAGS
jgi:hypothetical protein